MGSVLYVAAHPDDENTRLLTWLANEKQYRTGYLSLTRGDGGQNLLGDEQGTELGLIRTQELLAARRLDGAEQFFSRAFDFGFSKGPEETFRIWGKEKILSDAVWVIRKFQPDVIITRFPEDGRGGHGHHTASAIIAHEAFDAAADPKRFPEQFKYGVQPWQAKRLFWNGFGTAEGQSVSVDVGGYNPLLGKSYGEIAADSRTNHKSQGFGSARSRGSQRENLTLIKGEAPDSNFMSGVDVSWKRAGMEIIDKMLDSVINHFNPSDPSASVPQLVGIYNKLSNQDKPVSYWVQIKLSDIKEVIAACAGLFIEATTARQYVAEDDTLRYTINAVKRSNLKITTDLVTEPRAGIIAGAVGSMELLTNVNNTLPAKRKLTETFMRTQPYWLQQDMEKGTFNVTDQQLIGRAENEPLSATVGLNINGVRVQLTRPILYKNVDPVKGESYNPVIITPKEKIYSNNNLVLFRKGSKDSGQLVVTVASEETAAAKQVRLQLSGTHFTFSKELPEFKPVAGGATNFTIRIGNYLQPLGLEKDTLRIQLEDASTKQTFTNASRTITYDHIPTVNYFYRDAVQVLNIDLKTIGKTIGYIPGAGDKVPDALRQMGYTVTELSETTITPELLKTFDAVITGVRAYDVNSYMADKYDILMGYVQNGGNLIVQYNRNNLGQPQTKIGPYPFAIANKRVTEEDAAVTFGLPAHPVLNYPNNITQKDFTGWIQERSTYQAEQTDNHYDMPLSMHDTGEGDSNGSLMIGKYGKGNFVYASLVFFRELPAGVPGAYRLLANLIAL